ncbi:MAG: RNA polymerase sigma-70 factor [Bacteroidales bacterium]|nr:RNA polymerase sigma-70 factor [Bacteroidales bacterium]MBO5876841.1 RNA polymerase sigma-70 factor [Bacteroidales bacterium]
MLDHEDIIKKVAEGDKSSFDRLFFMYYPKVRKFLSYFIKSAEDAEDLAQDIFVKLWKNRRSLAAINNADNYFFVASKNSALTWLKKNSINTVRIEEGYCIPDEVRTDLNYEAFEKEQLIRMMAEQMPEDRRRVFLMSRFEGLSNADIAERLGIKKKTVENHINRALKDLKGFKLLIFLLFIWVHS